MFRRLTILAKASLAMPPRGRGGFAVAAACIAAAVAAVLVPSALAVRVHVRVEGKTTTIFGAAQPTLEAGANALTALDAASLAGEFYYHVTVTGFGPFVDQIGRYPGEGFSGWSYKVNGVAPPVGADQATIKGGDTVLWYWSTFTQQGGSPTLLLKRRAARNCYSVLSQNDLGQTTPAAGAKLVVDGRRVSTRAGRGCVGKHRGLVRATVEGAVRSNALR